MSKTRKFFGLSIVCLVALLPRVAGGARVPPYDDLYHLKRMAAFPAVLERDPDRGGLFCPWPPLYDFACGGFAHLFGMDAVLWLPPIGFALFAAWLAWRFGWIAGLGAALSPYLIGISRAGAIDHHWVEPMLVVSILLLSGGAAASAAHRRRSAGGSIALGVAITVALFVQPALIVAAALAFLVLFARREGAIAFAIPAILIVLYRLTRPPGYPDSPWFLGWPHAAALAAAAIACAASRHRPFALLCGALVVAPWTPMLASGLRFFGGDAWLESIVEFQPMFRDPSRVGTDIANLTGGVIAVLIARKTMNRPLLLFAIAYMLLALSSRRFLVVGIVLFAIAGAVAARRFAALAAALTLLPPLAWHAWALAHPEPPPAHVAVTESIARKVRDLPPGRVLAPWYLGHAIDVIGKHPVVLDNFGSMPDAKLFAEATAALKSPDPRPWCRANGVRYVVYADGRLLTVDQSRGM